MDRKLLFSVTKDECDWSTFTCGGKGGSGKDTSNNGARCTHRESGAVGEARDTRSQLLNRRSAFRRMVESEEFVAWHKIEVARRIGEGENLVRIEAAVDAAMDESNLRVEFF